MDCYRLTSEFRFLQAEVSKSMKRMKEIQAKLDTLLAESPINNWYVSGGQRGYYLGQEVITTNNSLRGALCQRFMGSRESMTMVTTAMMSLS